MHIDGRNLSMPPEPPLLTLTINPDLQMLHVSLLERGSLADCCSRCLVNLCI